MSHGRAPARPSPGPPSGARPASPTLVPTWMERQQLNDVLTEAGLQPLPPWSALVREGQTVRAEIAAGVRRWPPAVDAETLIGRKLHPDQPGGRAVPAVFDPHHLLCFAQLPAVERITAGLQRYRRVMPEGVVRNLVATQLSQLYHLATWQHYGRRIYLLDDDLFVLLAQTELPKFPASELRAPLPSFYVKFPEPAFYFQGADDAEPQLAEGALVALTRAEGADPEHTPLELSFLITGRSPAGALDDSVCFVSACVPPATRLADLAFPAFEHLNPRIGRALGLILPRVLLGLCLYLQSEHPFVEAVPPAPRRDPAGVSNPGKRRKIEQQNARVSRYGYVRVRQPFADRVPVTPPLAGAAADDPAAHAARWALDHQVWVEGHFRRVPVGPGGQGRKITWIRPHPRGPDTADVLAQRAQVRRVPDGHPRAGAPAPTAPGRTG